MSLVNKMLKDLEKHHQQEKGDSPSQGNGDGGPPPPPPLPNRKRRIIFYGSILSTVAILAALALLYVKSTPSSSTTLHASPQTSQSTPIAPDNHRSTILDKASATTTAQTDQMETLPSQSAASNNHGAQQQTSTATSATLEQPIPSNNTDESKPNSKTSVPANSASKHSSEAIAPTSNNASPAIKDNDTRSPFQSSQKEDSLPATIPPNTQKANADNRINVAKPILSKKQQLSNQYNQAMTDIHAGRNEQAITRLTTLLNQAPDYKNARVSLAAELIRQEQIHRAEAILKIGLKQAPKDPDYVKLYAHILVQQGHTAQALRLLVSAKPKTIRTDVNYYALMASLYMQQQDYRHAKNIYQRLVTQDPLNGTWWAGFGIAADKLGMTMQARNAFTRANKIGNLSPALQKYIDKDASYL